MGEVFAGRYELVDPIGRGGVGAVWRAWDRRRRRYVAAKVLQQRDAHSLLRFVREQALRIDHPHVLAPASWAADDDKVLFTMDLVAGGSLVHLVGDYGPLPHQFVCTLLDQLLSGLAAVHAEGVVHRDIKPANLLLEATGTARPRLRLSDFGIAMRLGEPRLTDTNLVVGTPGYISPEQMMGAEPDFPADLFAVGLVALYLLEGAKPDTKALVQYFAEHGTPGAPKGIPEPLWEVVATLLQPDPQARFRTATGARKALATARELLPEPGPDDELIEIFDQLGPLPPGFGPEGPLAPAAPAGPADGDDAADGTGGLAGGSGAAGTERWAAVEGATGTGGASGERPVTGGTTGEAGPAGATGTEFPAAGGTEGSVRPGPHTPRAPEPGALRHSGPPDSPGPSEPVEPSIPPEPSVPQVPGVSPPVPMGPAHSTPPSSSGPSSPEGPPPVSGSPWLQGTAPPSPSAAAPSSKPQESVHHEPDSPSWTPSPHGPPPPSGSPSSAPRPSASAMSDTGSFHLPPPQPTTTATTVPVSQSPSPPYPAPGFSPQTAAPWHPAEADSSWPGNPSQPPAPPPPASWPATGSRTDVPTAPYTAQVPVAAAPEAQPRPSPAASTARPHGRSRRARRKPGPPAGVVVPVLLLALACYVVGFWALIRL